MYKRLMRVVIRRIKWGWGGGSSWIKHNTNQGVTSVVMAEAFHPTFWFRVCSGAVPHVDSAAHGISAIKWTKKTKGNINTNLCLYILRKWPKSSVSKISIYIHCVLVSIYKSMKRFAVNNEAHKMILLMRLHWRFWKWIHVMQAMGKLLTVRIFQ